MKKILYVTTVSGTINAFLIPHIKMLISKGYIVDCACCIIKPIDTELIKLGVNIYNVPFARSPLNLKNIVAFNELIKIQKDNKYDLIHVHTPVASIFGRLLKVIYPKLKVIYTAHGYHFYSGAPRKNWILYYPVEKIMARLTDVTITINKEDYEITKKRLKPKKCYLVNGVGLDLNKYKKLSDEDKRIKRRELGIKEEEFVVIMIAELNKNKNQIQLIKAMEIIKDKYPNIKALLVGKGPMEEELKNEIKNRDLSNNVRLLGYRSDVNQLINISHIGVLLSYREGLPRNIMELMANEKMVIATDIRGCRDLIKNKDIGELVSIGDYKSTAKIIKKYYEEKSEGYNNKNIEIYNIDTIKKELSKIYSSLLV